MKSNHRSVVPLRHRQPTSARQQRGIILLMVLLIFSIVTLIASSMLERQSIDLERSATHLILQQSRSYAFSAEAAVKEGLYLDWDSNNEVDHAGEEWNQQRVFPLEPGTVAITIKDAQGRFNLNSLTPDFPNRDVQQERFSRLLNQLGLETDIAKTWSRWLDKESQVENDYLVNDPPYRASYLPCAHTSELLLIKDMDVDSYRKLESYVACLPAETRLNINTADDLVLLAIDKRMTDSMVSAVVSGRSNGGFESVEDFINLPELKPLFENDEESDDAKQATPLQAEDFSVMTEYFEVFARIDLEGRIASTEMLLKRDNGTGKFTTIYRDYSRREPRSEPPNATPGEVN